MKRTILLLSLFLFIASCADSPSEIITQEVTRVKEIVVTRLVTRPPKYRCTLLGCGYGLIIEIGGNRPQSFTMIVEYPEIGETVMESRECIGGKWKTSGKSCDLFPLQGSPNTILVSGFWKDEVQIQDIQPFYEEYLPNGPGCEPVCQQATVSFTFPSP